MNILTKRRPRKSYPFLDVKGNIVTKDEEICGAFFASVFSRKTSYPLGDQPLELVERDGEQN